MKKYFSFLILLLISFSLFACDNLFKPEDELIKLQAPNVTLESNIAVWEDNEKAVNWEISINGSNTFINKAITQYPLQEGFVFKIRAIGDNVNYSDSDWSNEVSYFQKTPEEDSIVSLVVEEYEALVNGETLDHTLWTITGKVVALDDKFNDTYNNYNVKAIIDCDGVLIGIYNGFVNGNYPVNIEGLEIGVLLTITGTISENYSLTVNGTYSKIEFSNPNMVWNNETLDGNIPNSNTVNFFMINDTHGAFVDSSEAVSIGRVDTLIDELTDANGKYIKIHDGDAFQGSYISGELFGKPLIEALNIMEFDCFVLGNHEFDWGLDKIKAYADGNLSNGEANFPFLGANIFYKGTNNRPDWIEEYTIVQYGDIEVGIIGVIGQYQESSILTSNVKDYEFIDPVPIIEKLSYELRTNKGCEVVVVATHEYDTELNEKIGNLKTESAVDAIFCAHTHQYISEDVTRKDGVKIPVVQNNHKNQRATDVKLYYDNDYKLISYNTSSLRPANYDISSDISSLINSYSNLINDSNLSLGSTKYEISRSTLGGYAVDAMIDYTYSNSSFDGKIDVAIINTGGVRATIDSGEITKSDVFEVFPFNNMVVLVNISGKLIKSLYSNNSNYLYIDVEESLGSYANLNDNEIYQLAIIDYVFESTYYDELKNLSEDDYVYSNIIMRDILIEYLDELYN